MQTEQHEQRRSSYSEPGVRTLASKEMDLTEEKSCKLENDGN